MDERVWDSAARMRGKQQNCVRVDQLRRQSGGDEDAVDALRRVTRLFAGECGGEVGWQRDSSGEIRDAARSVAEQKQTVSKNSKVEEEWRGRGGGGRMEG